MENQKKQNGISKLFANIQKPPKLFEGLYKNVKEHSDKEVELSSFLQQMVDLVGSFYNAGRCTFVIYDEGIKEYKVINEYRKSDTCKSVLNVTLTYELWEPCLAHMKSANKTILLDMKLKFISDDLKEKVKPYDIEHVICVPINKDGKLFGFIGIHKLTGDDDLNLENIELLDQVGAHISYLVDFLDLIKKEKLKVNRELILREIIESIASSLDISVLKKKTLSRLNELFEPDRLFIRFVEDETQSFLQVEKGSEYLSGPDVQSIKKFDTNSEAYKYIFNSIDRKEALIVYDTGKELTKDPDNIVLKMLVNEQNIKSCYVIPLNYNNKKLGSLVLQYTKSIKKLSQDDLKLLYTIADYMVIAITQANLYQQTRENAQRELLIRKITEAVSSTFDLNKIKQIVTNEVGKTFKADRCLFRKYDYYTANPKIVEHEYLCSKNIKSAKEFTLEDETYFFFTKNPNTLIKDVAAYIKENNLTNSSIEKHCCELELKSIYVFQIPLSKDNTVAISLHYVKKAVHLFNEDLQALETIIKQVEEAINRAQLYQDITKSAQREKVQNKIVSAIKTYSSIDDINNIIIHELSEYFNVDRIFINVTQNEKEPSELVKYAEYLSSEEMKSYRLTVFDDPAIQFFNNVFVQKGEIEYKDHIKFIKDNNLEGSEVERFIDEYQMVSCFATRIHYQDSLYGVVGFSSAKNYYFSNEEVEFIRTIAKQAGIAYSKALLYEELKHKAYKEEFLKNFALKIAKSLDMEEVLETICKESMQELNANYITLIEVPNIMDFSNWFIRKRMFSDNKTIIPPRFYDQASIEHYWREQITSGKDIYQCSDIYNSDMPKAFKDYLKVFNINSLMCAPVKKGDKLWGILYIYDSNNRVWKENELELLKMISSQAYYAITQAQMFGELKSQIEKEKILRLDDSMLINKTLADFIGLSSAVTYSSLLRAYNEANIVSSKQSNEYHKIKLSQMKNETCLDSYEVKSAIEKLKELRFIEAKALIDQELKYKINKNNEDIIKHCINQKKIEDRVKKLPDTKDKTIYTVKELEKLYSKYFEKEIIDATKYFIEKTNKNLVKLTISKHYYTLICKTLYEFSISYNVEKEALKIIIDAVFDSKVISKDKKLIGFGNSKKVLVERLKKIILYKLFESKLITNDFSSKIDMSAHEVTFAKDINSLEKLLLNE